MKKYALFARARLSALILTGFFGMQIHAATILDQISGVDKGDSTSLSVGAGEFGDKTNLSTGVTVFRATDVDLPTNSELRVQLARKFEFGSALRRITGAEDYIYEGKSDPIQHHKQVFGSGWDLDVPAIRGVFDLRTGWVTGDGAWGVTSNKRCTDGFVPPTVSGLWPNYISQVPAKIYWGGTKISIPGIGEEPLLSRVSTRPKPLGAEVYTGTTRSEWMVSCLPSVTGALGEGFKVRLPNGTKYYFDWMVMQRIPSIGTEESVSYSFGYTDGRLGLIGAYNGPRTLIPLGEYALYATKVEDRFGNWVKYDYDPANPQRLLAIRSNDGVTLSLTYEHSQIKTVTAGSQVWSYTYGHPSAPISYDQAYLKSLILPDQSSWQYSVQAGVYLHPTEGKEMWRGCNLKLLGMSSSIAPEPTRVGTISIVNPSGATSVFKFRNIVQGTNRTPGNCFANNPNATAKIEGAISAFVTPSLFEKTVTGPGIASQTWSIFYAPSWSWANACTAGNCANSSETRITNPDGVLQRYTFGNDYDANAGQLLDIKIESGGIVRKQITNTYIGSSAGQAFANSYGIDPHAGNNPFANKIRPLIATRIIQDGTSFETAVDNCGSASTYCFDAFARPTRMVSGNTLQSSRVVSTDYHDDYSNWVLGQKKREVGSDTTVISQVDYNAQALPSKVYRFGKLEGTMTYNADGTLASAIDGRNNVTALSNWKRGVPQLIEYPATAEAPAGSTRIATVDGDGWITSVTNEIGAKTCYTYDTMGRISSITYPSETALGICDSSRWSQTAINFVQVNAQEYGLEPGHWRHSYYQGNKHVNTYFDAMLRPVIEETFDYADLGGTLSQVVKRYDNSGRLVFQSYPTTGVGSFLLVMKGTRTFYDALGRAIRLEQDSELNTLSTTTEYLDALRTRVTDPRGNKTINGFMAWGEPSFDMPISSVQPEGKIITIKRHPQFGWPLAMTQRSADYSAQQTRHYVYDGNAMLCKTIEPETGASVMGYDAAGNLAWSASGLSGASYASTTDCNYAAANASGRVVNRNYDARNRLTALSFPDGLGNQSWSYEKDNLPASITTYNGAGNTQAVINRYAYNQRRMLSAEYVDQPLWYSWRIGYDYDAIGNLRWQSYPTGLTLDFAPNAFGQSTQVRDHTNHVYASGSGYHPNGALKQFTYGNGVVHSMTQNIRQLPAQVSQTGVMHYSYAYDANANINSIFELTRGDTYSRSMTYDALDRLTSAGSASFGGDSWHRLSYDALDNLKSWKLAGVKDYADYVYDTQHRLTNIRDSLGALQVSMNYDAQGNLAMKDTQNYTFDYGNRLRNVAGKESYRYDGLGRRVQTTKADGSMNLWMYGQNGQMLFSWDGPGAEKTHEHIYFAGSLIATVDHNWPSNSVIATNYQHTDALGSPVAVTNATGEVIERNVYEPFGAIVRKPNFTGVGFTGHVMDGATGLTYMQQRYYDQSIGRFLSVDPVSANANVGGNFNRYSYANNNPYKFFDPDGRFSIGAISYAASFLSGVSFSSIENQSQRPKPQDQKPYDENGTTQELETIRVSGLKVDVKTEPPQWKYGDANPPNQMMTPDQADIYMHWHQNQTLNTLVYPVFRALPKALRSGNPIKAIPSMFRDAYDSGKNMELNIPSQADIDKKRAAERKR